MDNTLILSIFNNKDDSDDAIDELKENDIDSKQISVIMKDKEMPKEMKDKIASSAKTGGIIGGIAGLLVGAGTIVIPALGAILVGGPIATAFGLTGAAATATTTVTGGIAGALSGGLIGALIGLGLSKEEAQRYADEIKEGAILIGVTTSENREPEVKEILSNHNAEDIKVVKVKVAESI